MRNFSLDVLVDLIALIFFCADNNYGRETNQEETV